MSVGLLFFARPWWLLALLPAALVVWRLKNASRGETAWRGAVDAHLLPHLLVGALTRQRRIGIAALACALAVAVLALAGPTLPQGQERAARRDALRVLMVELSPQMAPHLDRVRLALLELLRALPEGRTALLVYADEPYLVVPPTHDAETIARFIPELAVDAMPVAGNRPEHAWRMAGELAARNPASAHDLIWITAGAGAAGLPPLPPVRLSVLHAATADGALAALARASGGVSVAVEGDMRQLVSMLASGGSWRVERHATDSGSDIGAWLALALLPLAALAFRRGVLLAAFPLLCAGMLTPPDAVARELWLPPPLADYLAWRRYQAGDAQGAAQGFADRRWRAAASYRAGDYAQAAALLAGLPDFDANYNRGNALAKQGRLADAIAAYDAALKLRPDDADARHNRELVLRLLNRNASPPPSGKPPPSKDRPQNPEREAEREAARVAEQWLRAVPDEPATLLRRKLQIEHRRRAAGQAQRPW